MFDIPRDDLPTYAAVGFTGFSFIVLAIAYFTQMPSEGQIVTVFTGTATGGVGFLLGKAQPTKGQGEKP
ncbi:hypothetical protein [Heliophilum fasciatum]|uniref:Uncharacterized protein n=1 Tax=Heliophilum fasciatum TaxID=35700 RepID=A0A4R2RLI5_9FIRM|nr:hypothetical protein [Heliophilum fasciatum]MCW2277715.1 hypothetical protein [Heliophilum fasciatum]TCP64790.1 hypothetical protein EDD73_108143 [Heliophilum fasciatum]